MAAKFGLDPCRWTMRRCNASCATCIATREETFLHGTRQALLNHTERMLQLERGCASRFPNRTRADALRTRKGSRIQAGQPAGRRFDQTTTRTAWRPGS
jgi:hypothetical protein